MTPLEFDARHLWHPYTNVLNPGPMHLITGAEGVWLTREDGTQMIDAMSSWWCAVHGHRHPAIISAMQDQLARMPHVMFGGLTHEPAVELGRRLISLLPDGLDRIFYSDSGSVAIEVALKWLCSIRWPWVVPSARNSPPFAAVTMATPGRR